MELPAEWICVLAGKEGERLPRLTQRRRKAIMDVWLANGRKTLSNKKTRKIIAGPDRKGHRARRGT